MKYSKEVFELLAKADRSFQASKKLIESGYPEFAVSRSYYAMFYCAEAVLLSKGQTYSKHSAVIAAFGKDFVKTGIFPKEMHAFLRNAFDLRARGDYETVPVGEVEAQKLQGDASSFIQRSREYIENITP